MRRPRPLTLIIIAEVVGCILLAALALAAVFSPAPPIPLVTLMPTPAASTPEQQPNGEGLTPSAVPSAAPAEEATQSAAAASDTPFAPVVETATPIVLPTTAPPDTGGDKPRPYTPTVLIASDTPAEILPTVPSRTPRPPSATPGA